MAVRRVILGLAYAMTSAGAVHAASPQPVRLPLSLSVFESATEIAYHPSRWLTIRRSIAFERPSYLQESAAVAQPTALRARAFAMSGDIHPFGNGFRLSLGVRADDNRRLLRNRNDAADARAARFAPVVSIGFAEDVGDGLSIGADVGLQGHDRARAGSAMLITPVEAAQGARDDARAYRPMLHLSAGYRF